MIPTMAVIVYIVLGGLMATLLMGKMIRSDIDDDDAVATGLDIIIWLIVLAVWPAIVAGAGLLALFWLIGYGVKELMK